MLIRIHITQADAVRSGSEQYGDLQLEVLVAELSELERECLARLLEGDAPDELLHDGRIIVPSADIPGLIHAIEDAPLRSSKQKELDELLVAAGSPPVESNREKLLATRDFLFAPIDEWPRYAPAADVGHSEFCSRPKASFRVEDHKPDKDQQVELVGVLYAARQIKGRVTVMARRHRGYCADCKGTAELYGTLVEITTPAGNHFSRELALQPPSQTL